VDRLRRWYRAGLLCIGDAAHAMSPIGGVGINLAIQDAVAAANRLAPKLSRGTVSIADLAAIQRRREFAAKATQALQIAIQRNVIGRVLESGRAPLLKYVPAIARAMPFLPHVLGRLVAFGVRPERLMET
jgi:2-polyprenyl-6-methoxyphenol hydroxylase-like FAD-dependent oxidoreductase